MDLFIFLVLCGSFIVTHGSSLVENWQQWKLEYNKKYANMQEEQERRNIWMQSYHQIIQHATDKNHYDIGLNQFSDLVIEW